MNQRRIPTILVVLTLVSGSFALAQDAQDVPETVDEANDGEAITLLDQTVPVADEVVPDEDNPDVDDGIPDQSELIEQYVRFNELLAANVYDEAENVAKRVVELAILFSGPRSEDAAKALTNLGVVQTRVGNYEAAMQNFSASVDIIEENSDLLNEALVNPLKGLGATQLELGRPDLASRTYQRAVHITHVNEGPHNRDQIEILEALAEANLRLGLLEDARNYHDMVYNLNLRHFDPEALEIIPSLMRRAAWQHRTGYYMDERATYRRIIRIIETVNGKDDISLIEPLKELGRSYFFVDVNDTGGFQGTSPASGELYFKRAVRIATENPDADWVMLADTKLALADYYNLRSDASRARRTYRDAWNIMSEADDRLAMRNQTLEGVIVLNEEPLPRYTGGATREDRSNSNEDLREGRISFTYNINSRGRVTDLQIVEIMPEDFSDMTRSVQRELRTRVFRPRFEDAEPVDTTDRVFTHTYYYLQEELDRMREEEAGTNAG